MNLFEAFEAFENGIEKPSNLESKFETDKKCLIHNNFRA